jgi:hypothetical protein
MNEPDYYTLIKSLNGWNAASRKAAKAQLKELTPGQLVMLTNVEIDVRRRLYNLYNAPFRIVCLLFSLCLIYTINSSGYRYMPVLRTFHGDLLFYIYPLLLATTLIQGSSRARKAIAHIIENTENPEFVQPALEVLSKSQTLRRAFSKKSPPVEASLRTALKRLLPKFQYGQLDSWTTRQKHALFIPFIEPMFDPELTICMLNTLQQVGDESALLPVERLTKLGGIGPESRVRAAAEECLAALRVKVEQGRDASRLLRPVLTPEDQAAMLLRPAIGATTAAESLLRVIE